MGKNKSSSKASKKTSNGSTDKKEDGKASSKNKDGKPGLPKNKGDNKSDAKTTKGGNNVKTKSGSSGLSSLWLLIGLGVVIGVAAIIYTNEDVQMFFVKLTPFGSKPWESIVDSHQNSEDVKQSKPDVFKAKEDNRQNTQETVKQFNTDGSDKSGSTVKDSKKAADAKSAETEGKETKGVGGGAVEDNVNEDDKTEKTDDDAEVKKKKKSTWEDYPRSKITNKADFKIRKKLDAADSLLKEKDVAKAVEKFDAILKDHPESPRALWGKGQVLDAMAERQRSNALLEESMGILDRAMKLENTPKALVEEIGRKLAERQGFRGWMGKEAATWRYLASQFPDRVEFENLQGVAYLKMGKIDHARTVFQQVLDRYPDNGFGLVHLGFILKTSDHSYKEAIPMLQKGIDSKEPGVTDARFYTHLGDAYHRMNQTEKAKEIYKQGYKLGLFLSEYQRSTYNAETPITGRPWWTPEQTTYKQHLQMLEKNWKIIREEGMAQLNKKAGSFRPEDENLSDTGDWKQLTLFHRGQKDEAQCKKAPKTCALIDQFPAARDCTRGQVKYSLMHPGVHVWPHTGPTNCRIRSHLGLVIPEGPRIRVAEEVRTWKEGKFIIFDDSFEHEVWHNGTELRLILIVDFWHPEIPEWERRSLSPI